MDLRIIIIAAAVLVYGPLYAQPVNIALEKPVFEIGGPFGYPSPPPGVWPIVVTDGIFVPEGSDWPNGSWWYDWECSFIPPEPPGAQPEACALEIDLQGDFLIYSLIFQGDSDHYSLEYWNLGAGSWQPVWLVPEGNIANTSTRSEEFLDPPIITNRLRIAGVGGDGIYSVSEVQAFGDPLDPCTAGGGTPANAGCWSEEPEFQTHVTAGETCYRFKLTCDGFVNGGFGTCVYPNGFFDAGMHAQTGDPHEFVPGEPECGTGGGHMLNDKVEYSCSLDGDGKVELNVKKVGMVHCVRER